jgi:hypothetical protein
MTTFLRQLPAHSHTHPVQLQQQQRPNSQGFLAAEAQGLAPKQQQHTGWDHLLPKPLQQQDQQQLAVLAMLVHHMPTWSQEV